MATTYWLGTADAVAQVATVQITAYDAATTYTLTVGGQTVSVTGDTDVNTTASNLSAAWNNATGAYFTGITATVSTDTVTLTADTAGVPFTVTSSASGGTGTIGSVTVTTASAGPNDWSTAANWSGGSVPSNSDDVIIADTSTPILWGLAQSAVALSTLTIKKTFTGKIGLDYTVFATSADGATTVSTEAEYRDTYLQIGASTVKIGEQFGQGNPNGSGRILLDLGSTAAEVTVYGTAANPSETGRGAVRLLANSASTNVFVRSAPGGVAIANEKGGETSTVAKVAVTDTSSSSRVVAGEGVTITTWSQRGGVNTLLAAATVTTVTVDGGTLTTEGDYTITTMNMNNGTVYANHIKTSGNHITTLNANGGQVDFSRSGEARTVATVNLSVGVALSGNDSLTITTLNEPTTKPYTLTVS